MEPEDAAAVEQVKRTVKRTVGLLQGAAVALARLASDEHDTLGVLSCHDTDSCRAAVELIRMGVVRHGSVDVIVLARQGRSTPTTAARAAKERKHGPHSTSSNGGRPG
jgi:hypothetical protein